MESGSGNGRPSVSVLMPVYNAARYLDKAVESIVGQSFTDWELVAVNDGSKDSSGEILERWSQNDSRIRVIHQNNQGCCRALNRGLQECRAELIARMDSDDISRPERLSKQYAFMQSHPEILLVGGAILHIDEDGDSLMVERFPTDPAKLEANLLVSGRTLAHPAVMYRRSAVLKVGGYDHVPTSEDFLMWLKLAEIGPLANLDDIVLDYRRHSSSMVQSNMDVSHKIVTEALADARRRRNLPPIPNEVRKPKRAAKGMTLSGKLARQAARNGFHGSAFKHLRRQIIHSPMSLATARVTFETILRSSLSALTRKQPTN